MKELAPRHPGGQPPGTRQKLSGKRLKFVLAYLEGKTPLESALTAGYVPKSASHRAWSLTHRDQAVIEAIKQGQAELRERNQITCEAMVVQLDEDRQFAIETKNATAAVRASELKCKLAGLMIERVDQRSVGTLQVSIVKFSDMEVKDG